MGTVDELSPIIVHELIVINFTNASTKRLEKFFCLFKGHICISLSLRKYKIFIKNLLRNLLMSTIGITVLKTKLKVVK